MEKENIQTLESIRRHFPSLKNSNSLHKKSLSPLERLAVFITQNVGTMGFFFLIFAWTIIWLGWNIFAPPYLKFDPFPAFVLWLFLSNMIQIFLMPLIMVGQNIQGKHAELRAAHDLETDTKAEKEIETILLRLEQQNELILDMRKKLEKLGRGGLPHAS